MSEKITFIIGAGFSHALAKLPLTSCLTKKISESINQNRSKFTNENFFNWVIKLFENRNFEKANELILHCIELCTSKPFFINKNMEFEARLAKDLIIESLFKSLSTFNLNQSHKKFKEIVEYYIQNGFQVDVFDLNFDEVFEKIFFKEDYYNDFFTVSERHKLFMNNQEFSVKEFNPEIKKQLNHYKPHGALNIFRIEFSDGYYDSILPNNLYKSNISASIVGNCLNAPLNFQPILNFQENNLLHKGSLPVYPALIIGNIMKDLNQARPHLFSNHWQEDLLNSVHETNAVVSIGFSNKDSDVTNIFTKHYLRSISKDIGLLHHKNKRVHGVTFSTFKTPELDTSDKNPDLIAWINDIHDQIFKKNQK